MGIFGSDDTAGLQRQVRDLEQRLARVEGLLDSIFAQAGVEPPADAGPGELRIGGTPVSAEVVELKRAGRPIEAIKQLRAETSLGLAEAKKIVDQI